jgi:tRNA synthetase class I (R)
VNSDTYIVNFCERATAGALRVDQLRSVALGHALSCLLEAAGAHVERQRQIADVGCEFCKASAAYLAYADSLDPAAAGEKSDHFVGRMCGLYDKEQYGELADLLFVRFTSGEKEARTVWQVIRGWTLSGQNETLSRLGVCFQRTLFYSELTQQTEPLLALARTQGLLDSSECVTSGCRSADESTPRPGMSSYTSSVSRLYELTIWRSTMIEFPGAVFIRVTDDQQHEHLEEHLRALVPGAHAYPSAILYNSSSADRNEGASSSGLAIDDLLDTLATREELRALTNEERPSCSARDLATTVLLGGALGKSLNGRFEVSERHLLWTDVNPGWILAQAWAKVCATADDGDSFAMLPERRHSWFHASKELRPLIDRAVETLDVLELLHFLVRVGGSYLEGVTAETVSKDVCSLLGTGLEALGLVRPAGSLKGVE